MASHLTEHWQFFGKVHDSGYGRGDNFCKLTESFYVHFVSLGRTDHGHLTNVLRLKGAEGRSLNGATPEHGPARRNRKSYLRVFQPRGPLVRSIE